MKYLTENRKDFQDERWNSRYQELVAFRAAKPERWPNRAKPDPKEKSLYSWCKAQRSLYRKGKLSTERFALLVKMNFFSPKESFWFRNFRQLENFIEKFKVFPPSGHYLYAWSRNQQHNKNLSEQQQHSIERVMRSHYKSRTAIEAENWDTKLKAFQEFYNQQGLPCKRNGMAIYKWMMDQRLQLRNGKMPADRIKKWEAVAMEEVNQIPIKRNWSERFGDLEYFIQTERRWPNAASVLPQERSLYNWCIMQRLKYKSIKSAGLPLSKKQVELLTNIGFKFSGKLGTTVNMRRQQLEPELT